MRLLLVRHGQTSWNILGRAQGHTDIPLDPTGQEQAAALAATLSGVAVNRVLASDLLRAKETAEALGLPVETKHSLRERSFGEWEGQNYVQVMANLEELAERQGTDRLRVRPPGGESFADVWERVRPVVDELKKADETTVVVTHGAAKAVILAQLLEGSLETVRGFRFPNCGITEFERRSDGTLVMTRYAERPGP